MKYTNEDNHLNELLIPSKQLLKYTWKKHDKCYSLCNDMLLFKNVIPVVKVIVTNK